MKNRTLALILALAMMAGMLAGCGNSSNDATGGGDSIIVGISDDATAMDPLSINDTNTMSILSNIYEPLVRVNNKNEIIPGLAEKWSVSDDGLEYTFTIRKGVKFHNGEDVTLEDVKWSIEAQVASSYTGPYISCVDHVEIVDDSNIKIVLSYPYAPFLTLCGTYTYVMKESFYGEGGNMAQQPIGCGPYEFVSWAANDKIVLKAYPDYFGGAAKITNLTFKIISNQTSAAISLEAGDIDMYLNVAETDVATLKSNSNIVVDEKPSSAFYYLGLNTEDEILSNEKVRQAIAKAIDRDSMVVGVLDGYAQATRSFIPEGLPGYKADFDPLPYHVDDAKALLAEAGYPNGLDLVITVPESRSAHAQMVQADLKKIGINLTINMRETGAFWDDLENGEYQIMMMGWSYVVMDNDVGYYSLYQSKEVVSGNYPRLNDARVDELLQKGRESSDPAERDAIYGEMEEIVMTSGAYIPLYWRYSIIAYNSKIQNVTNSPCGFYFVYDYSWAA